MRKIVGIRREDKNVWEKRVPLIPSDMMSVAKEHQIDFIVQPSPIRVFSDDEYRQSGAYVSEDLSRCHIVFAIKEIPINLIEKEKTYIFFSHVIKGQPHNMPMLKKIMENKCTLIDYEKVVDEEGRRLIFFGEYAGIAGMIDTLWSLGKRLVWEGIKNPFSEIKQCKDYGSLSEAQGDIMKVSEEIKSHGLPRKLIPFVVGIAGYGNVARGVQKILDLLPTKELTPDALLLSKGEKNERGGGFPDDRVIYKIVFKEEHMVEPVEKGNVFELKDYYEHPEKYKGCFEKYVPYLSVLMNCIYWEKRYPRLVTKDFVKKLYSGGLRPKLKVIGDISCDVEGAIECTVQCTNPGSPVFVYDVVHEKAVEGWEGDGPVILAVDNLPCELPRESSEYFSSVLKKYVSAIADAHFSKGFDELDLPREIKGAVIVYRGELTPKYKYLEKYL